MSFAGRGAPSTMPEDPVVILDPVNADNNVARRLTDPERAEIVATAQKAWETLLTASYAAPKGKTIDYWKEVFGPTFRIED
jgi:tRNA nucleotidyltransferase (CCA-adding enzyme)